MGALVRSLAVVLVVGLPRAAAAQASANGLPSVSPDGRLVAFVGSRDGHDRLFLIDADGRHQRELPVGDTDGRMPRWSAAGEVLYGGTGPDTGTVFAARINGGTPRLVASVPGRSPVLAPNGRSVLYLAGPGTSTALVEAAADGSLARTIAGGGTTAWNGAWSPDGGSVAYAYGDSTRRLQVHVVGRDGSGDRALTHTTREEGSAQMPAWSPDGRRLAVQVNRLAAHSSEIWIVDVATGAVRRPAPHADAWLDETPSWFPDGTSLAFQSNRTGAMEVWVMNADGSRARQLTGRAATPR